MNAFDKLMRAVQAAIAKGKRTVRRKPRQHYIAREFYLPPVTYPDVSRLAECFQSPPMPVEPAIAKVAPIATPEAPKRPEPTQAAPRRRSEDYFPKGLHFFGNQPERRVATPKPPPVPPREHEQRVLWPLPDLTQGYGLNFSGLTPRADGAFVHRAGVILPNGELLEDCE